MPLTQNKTFETPEIGLAGFLSLELGIDPQYRWEGRSCYFVFIGEEDVHERIEDSVYDYVAGDARVDPRKYTLKCSHLKSEMFRNK